MHTDDTTLDALDWQALRDALATQARTPMGRRAAAKLSPLRGLHAVHHALDATSEVLDFERGGAWIAVGGLADVADAFKRAARGAVLEADTLRQVGDALVQLNRLADTLLGAEADIPVLRALAPGLQTDPEVGFTLAGAFDDTGALSGATYPELAALRSRIADLHGSIKRTLDELVRGDELGESLQDRFVTQRRDRYVVPLKANYGTRSVGIVHGMSASGQTAFVEPFAVVNLNNDLRLAEGELEAAERRILAMLSALVGRIADGALAAYKVATEVDLACARAGLAQKLDATRPKVGTDGVLHLTEARHPVLALRGLDVVANTLRLDASTPILVLSGPNTGGKTIALKTLGLCALLAACGCYVPAAEGSRVDLCTSVLALIGDHQTVHGDHSSFSSHLAGLHQMLHRAGPGALFLVDEIASGTDPTQGAALAHAILERLLESGARALVTTHFHRLKTLGALDPRFAIAGMQFSDGRPTYRLVTGASGESHALAIAERIGLDAPLLQRARDLLGEDERSLTDALAALDAEKNKAETAHREALALRAEVEATRRKLAEREEKLDARTAKAEAELGEGFRQRLHKADAAIAAVIADLQRNPSHAGVDRARAALGALAGLAPKPRTVPEPAPTPEPSATLAVGDAVRLTKLHKSGEVVAISDREVQVRVGPMTLRVRPDEVAPDRTAAPRTPPTKPRRATPPPSPTADLDAAMRHGLNTLNLRGKRVEEGLEELDAFLASASSRAFPVIFILHGHGTGAMKQAVRRWLPSHALVAGWTPANPDQGGDAYTVVAVR